MKTRLAAVAVAAAVLLAACTSGKDGGSTTSAPQGMPTTAAGLGSLVHSGVADLKSARLQMTLSVSGAQLDGRGVEQLDAGAVTAVDLTANMVGVGAIRVIHVDGQTYARLPRAMNPTGKPYLRVNPDSSNPVVHELAPYLDAALTAVSPASLGELAAAAQSVTVDGTQTVNGVPATHYVLKVDVTKLAPTFPGRAQLSAGNQPLPLDLYVARDGRPAQADLHLTVNGQDVPIEVKFSDYNTPVSISAPPAGQTAG